MASARFARSAEVMSVSVIRTPPGRSKAAAAGNAIFFLYRRRRTPVRGYLGGGVERIHAEFAEETKKGVIKKKNTVYRLVIILL